MPPRILIFGTGAVGSIFAYLLSRQIPASNIVCICRSNYDIAKSHGFTINSTLWGNNLTVKPTIVRNINEATTLSPEPYTYILITAKSLPTNPSLASTLKPVISPNTSTILIQNGINIEHPYSTLYPHNPLLSAVVYLPATQTSPGITAHKEIEHTLVGTYPSTASASHKSAAEAFTSLLRSCSATADHKDDIQSARWSKLLVNAAWNPICALTRSRDIEFLKTTTVAGGEEETVAYVRDVMREIASIAQAYGYEEINEELVEYQIGRARARELPGVEPSMLADARRGARMEVDAIVGNVLAMGREKGVKTPLLRGLYLLLSGLDESFARDVKK